MVAPNREIANINYSFYNSAMSHSIEVCAISEDVNVDVPRGRSISSSPNSSRELLAHSDLSSVPYVDRMEARNDYPSWANQTEQENFHLSYATLKKGIPNIQNMSGVVYTRR